MKTASDVQAWLGYLYPAEVDYLKACARALGPDGRVVNIGAGGGTSGLAFMESHPSLDLWTIDIQLEASPLGCLEGERVVLEEAGLLPSPRYHPIHGRSQDVARAWPGPLVDIVFVDGGHEYQEAHDDINFWLPHLKPGGKMLVHDYNKVAFHSQTDLEGAGLPWEEQVKRFKAYPGVDRAVRELLKGRFVHLATIDTLISFENTLVDPGPFPGGWNK